MYTVYEGDIKVEVQLLTNGYRYRALDCGVIVAAAGGITTAAGGITTADKAEQQGREAARSYAKNTIRTRIKN